MTQLLFSMAAIAALVALAWILGFRSQPVLGESDATDEAEAMLPGFRAQACLVAADGRAALVHGIDGSRALVAPKGDRWVVRRLDNAAIRQVGERELRIDCHDTGLRAVRFPLDGTPPGWIGAQTEQA
ncbi:MAG: hypothetical protein ACK4MX_04635 [Thermaurantiacus sp.]